MVPDPSPAFQRYEQLLGWALYPTLTLLIFVDLRVGIHGRPELISAQLVGFSLLTLLTLPFWRLRRGELTATAQRMLVPFAVILAWALVSSLVTRRPYLQWVRVPRQYLVVPVLTAIVTLGAAWGLVLAVPQHLRRDWLWWGAVTVVVATVLEWPRMALGTHDVRLATGMGGAATIHLVLLLTAAVFAGSALAGRHTRVSWVGAAFSLVLVLATGSRAGLLCLALAGGMLLLWAAARGRGRIAVSVAAGSVVVLGLLLLAVPTLRRVLVLGDELRRANLHTALRVFNISWHNRVLGAGSGRLWPWYAFETAKLRVPWRGQVLGEFGYTQTSPHSTFLGITVELGLVCMALFMVFCAVLVLRLVHEWRAGDDPLAFLVSVAMVASLVANVFDTYLLKNFGVSLWWWLVLATVLGTGCGPSSDAGLARPAGRGGATSAARGSAAPAGVAR